MKRLTIRLPDELVARIDAESRERKVSRSDIVRERLQGYAAPGRGRPAGVEDIKDLVGSVDGLPADLSAKKKLRLKATGYGL